MTIEDWHNAQVIEATTPEDGREALHRLWDFGVWRSFGDDGAYYGPYDLSDVRVIVDRDGNVAPPPITVQMLHDAAMVITRLRDGTSNSVDVAQEVLTAALRRP